MDWCRCSSGRRQQGDYVVCWQGENRLQEKRLCIAELPERIAELPDDIRRLCERILHVERVCGYAVPPAAMHGWIEEHFGSVAGVREQIIVRVTNRLTLDTAIFNPLRSRRPSVYGSSAADAHGDAALEETIAAETGPGSMFRDVYDKTTADVFGRIEGQHCTTASNVAKYDAWHGLVVFKEPNPLRFTAEQLGDYFDVAVRWLLAAHAVDAEARYPLITWNCLWKGGASVTHGHLQMTLSRGMAAGQVERLRRVHAGYALDYGGHYCADVWRLHAALGLGFYEDETMQGYVTLTPVKDRELALLSTCLAGRQSWGGETMAETLYGLWDVLYRALRNLIDCQGVRSFNVAVYLPPFGPTDEQWDGLPIVVRVVDRGSPLSRMVSIGSMEIFASSIVGTDPFVVAALLAQ